MLHGSSRSAGAAGCFLLPCGFKDRGESGGNGERGSGYGDLRYGSLYLLLWGKDDLQGSVADGMPDSRSPGGEHGIYSGVF